jgi:hypothetical protein
MPTRTRPAVKYESVLRLPPLPDDQQVALRDNNGLLVPILVGGWGPRRRIIDGSDRKATADDQGYDCPVTV